MDDPRIILIAKPAEPMQNIGHYPPIEPAIEPQQWRCQGCGAQFGESSMDEFLEGAHHLLCHRAISTDKWCGPVVEKGHI
jgi:hypothetical protein